MYCDRMKHRLRRDRFRLQNSTISGLLRVNLFVGDDNGLNNTQVQLRENERNIPDRIVLYPHSIRMDITDEKYSCCRELEPRSQQMDQLTEDTDISNEFDNDNDVDFDKFESNSEDNCHADFFAWSSKEEVATNGEEEGLRKFTKISNKTIKKSTKSLGATLTSASKSFKLRKDIACNNCKKLQEKQEKATKAFELKLKSRDIAIATLERTTEYQSNEIQKLREEIEAKNSTIMKLIKREEFSDDREMKLQHELDEQKKCVSFLKDQFEKQQDPRQNQEELQVMKQERAKLNKLVQTLQLRLEFKDLKLQDTIAAFTKTKNTVSKIVDVISTISIDRNKSRKVYDPQKERI